MESRIQLGLVVDSSSFSLKKSSHSMLMAPSTVTVNSLAFLGPPQVPAMSEFHYVCVVRIGGLQAHVALIDPDGVDDDFSEPIDIDIIKRRQVSDDESMLWPGSLVGSPVAFIQPDGLDMDAWTYGVVTGYTMTGRDPLLHLRYADGARKLTLRQPMNVVKVEWTDYVLQIEASTNSAAVNASELMNKLDGVRALCAKSRSGLPAKVANAQSVPFEPTSLVPEIRPDSLAVV